MWQLPLQLPRSSWQDLVDQAVAIIDVLDNHDILNDDVHPENFLLSRAGKVTRSSIGYS